VPDSAAASTAGRVGHGGTRPVLGEDGGSQIVSTVKKSTASLLPRPVMPSGEGDILAIPEVGGLHHRYERCAA
jgi:hypothetical protein